MYTIHYLCITHVIRINELLAYLLTIQYSLYPQTHWHPIAIHLHIIGYFRDLREADRVLLAIGVSSEISNIAGDETAIQSNFHSVFFPAFENIDAFQRHRTDN